MGQPPAVLHRGDLWDIRNNSSLERTFQPRARNPSFLEGFKSMRIWWYTDRGGVFIPGWIQIHEDLVGHGSAVALDWLDSMSKSFPNLTNSVIPRFYQCLVKPIPPSEPAVTFPGDPSPGYLGAPGSRIGHSPHVSPRLICLPALQAPEVAGTPSGCACPPAVPLIPAGFTPESTKRSLKSSWSCSRRENRPGKKSQSFSKCWKKGSRCSEGPGGFMEVGNGKLDCSRSQSQEIWDLRWDGQDWDGSRSADSHCSSPGDPRIRGHSLGGFSSRSQPHFQVGCSWGGMGWEEATCSEGWRRETPGRSRDFLGLWDHGMMGSCPKIVLSAWTIQSVIPVPQLLGLWDHGIVGWCPYPFSMDFPKPYFCPTTSCNHGMMG